MAGLSLKVALSFSIDCHEYSLALTKASAISKAAVSVKDGLLIALEKSKTSETIEWILPSFRFTLIVE